MSSRHRSGWISLFWAAFKRSENAMMLIDAERRCVEVNGACVTQLGYRRDALVGSHVWEHVMGGPQLSEAEWLAMLDRAEFQGEAEIERADGIRMSVQYAAHPEVVTGRQLILLVVVKTARRGRFARRHATRGPSGALSAREREVVHHVSLGRSGPEIAEELQIAHHTVRSHVRNAQEKLGARSRAQLVAMTLAEGHHHAPPPED